jgi:hypothetical protein
MASDQSQQGNQKKERDRLIKAGKTPKEASRLAKQRYPLSKDQAKRKNAQPKGGYGGSPGGGTKGFGSGKDHYGGSSSSFGKR